MSFIDATHTEAMHMQEFRDRWEYVHGNRGRPNLVTFANNEGRWFPTAGAEDKLWLPEGDEYTDYLILSDHNREPLDVNTERIGNRKRMINSRMRSYHVADKRTFNLSWTDIPSRAYSVMNGYKTWADGGPVAKFTADGGAGGVEMLNWYDSHPGSFYIFLSFDAASVELTGAGVWGGYARVYEVMIDDFSYVPTKRSPGYPGPGNTMYYLDLWNVSMSLEEV
jgi:hypothetical protein